MDEEVVAKLKSKYPNTEVFFGEYKSKIEAYNADIDKFDFEVLVLASDDMQVVQKDYDKLILEFMYRNFPNLDGVLWFDTCDGNKITDTLSIMGRSHYKRFGYAYNPDYLGYYCDDEFTQVAFKLGRIKRIDMPIICHNMPDYNKMAEDGTYLKSLVHGTRDKALYKVRKKVQFDLPSASRNACREMPKAFFQESRNKNQNSWRVSYPRFDEPISSMEVYILENMDRKVASMDVEQFLSFANSYFRDFRWSIPAVIHQIWFGDIPSNIKEMMDTFSVDYMQKNPGWRYIFWDEKRLKSIDMMNGDIFQSEKSYDCKSDIARLEILNKFGGFYVDSDCVWLGNKTLSSVPSKNGIMIAYEKEGESIGTGLLGKDKKRCANGVFGSTIANPIIAFIMGKLRNSYCSNRIKGAVSATGPDFVQGVLNSLSNLVRISSHEYFYPKWWCVDPTRNPEHEQFLFQRNLPVVDLARFYPEAVLFHKGYTSSNNEVIS
jgi:mannosyltransferase OCH1-like enzyme